MGKGESRKKSPDGASQGFEATLWAAADKLRGNMDASVYKYVVLGLIFLKYIYELSHQEMNALSGTRDALLPKLLSGGITAV